MGAYLILQVSHGYLSAETGPNELAQGFNRGTLSLT